MENNLINRELIIGGLYKHFKGNFYIVVGIANDSNNPENKVVVYKNYQTSQMWIRPYDEFVSKVDKEKYPNVVQEYRFEFIKLSENKENL